jgi:hypothetical protein
MNKSFLSLLCIIALFSGCSKMDSLREPAPTVVTFEEAGEASLANSIYGDNLYDGTYIPYVHKASGMTFGYAYSSFEYGGYVYSSWNGIALSQWTDRATMGYTNQCSVFYHNSTTGTGGHMGSSTFAVVYLGTDAVISFEDPEKEVEIVSMYVNNSTYTALSMKIGDLFAKSFSYTDQDWFKLNITGLSKDGVETGTVAVYLADFRTPTAEGIRTLWEKVDLTTLGKVHSLTFSLQSSDTGAYGMNTPSYFCLDNITFKDSYQ